MTTPINATSAARIAVLLVDDERALLDAMRLGLENEFDVETASSAADAEMLLATGRHDVIVCDHLMPDEVGLDFLINAARWHPRAKRILITGYMNPELISRSVQIAGLSACLLKPVPPEQLRSAIRTSLVGPT